MDFGWRCQAELRLGRLKQRAENLYPLTMSETSSQPGGGQPTVDLSSYSPGRFDRGAGRLKEVLWLVVSLVLFRLCPFSFSALKCSVLRAFGAKIGKNVTIKPQVKITFPWKLTVGDHVWLGEECWLLNLERITLGSHVCISQRAFLCTGSHDYTRIRFDLITKPILLENGAWLGAGCWVGPGVTVGAHAVLTAGSVAAKNLETNGIYRGNPAAFVKPRVIS
jgi:putative colanic acid biosynthesis acetyltransferase WcaF